jgi:hypothetical protein
MKSACVAAVLLSLTFETCVVDDTPGQGSTNLVQCTPATLLSGDGTNCLTVTVTNPQSFPSASSITVVATFANGSTSNVVLGPGSQTTFSCNLTSITAHETGAARSVVNWNW